MDDTGNAITIIGKDASFKGELGNAKHVQILGNFEGQISTPGEMEILPGATVKADIEAGTVVVEGSIGGKLTTTDIVHIKSTANVQGDICSGRLVVDDGARLNGQCQVGNANP